jgi:signal peptidase I
LSGSGKSAGRSVGEFVGIVAVAVLLVLGIQAFIVKPYKIPSSSMEPTLKVGQHIVVDRVGMHFSSPHVGEIMVFHPPADDSACADPKQGQVDGGGSSAQACDVAQRTRSSATFVKRVVGLPGDRLQLVGGHVIRDGKRESDSYTIACQGQSYCNYPTAIVVPKGDYYMLGDNRSDSEDSRFWGPVPRAWLIGPAFLTYWPPNRIGTL